MDFFGGGGGRFVISDLGLVVVLFSCDFGFFCYFDLLVLACGCVVLFDL